MGLGCTSSSFRWGIYLWCTIMVTIVIGEDSNFGLDEEKAISTTASSIIKFSKAFYAVLTHEFKENFVCSPFGVSTVMAMIKAGASSGSPTSEDIATALHFPEAEGDDTLMVGFKGLIRLFKASSETSSVLQMVNRIYLQNDVEVHPDYSEKLKHYFDATISTIDFEDTKKAAEEINNFVEEETQGTIKHLVMPSALVGNMRIVLVNAIHFKGSWKVPFDKKNTKKDDFAVSHDEIVPVSMMNLRFYFLYAELKDLDCRAIAIPYKGDEYFMIIMLPNSMDGLTDMEKKMETFSLMTIPDFMAPKEVNLTLPIFKIDTSVDLAVPLSHLGAGSSLDGTKSDFSRITTDKNDELHVSKGIQKAFIMVNEEGSEAAAARALGGRGQSTDESGVDPNVLQFKADHPFSFAIVKYRRELKEGAFVRSGSSLVMFGGKYVGPAQSLAPM